MIDLSERPINPEIGNCDLFSDARRKTCYERGTISITFLIVYLSFRSKLTVTDIRVSLPSPYGDGAKTQGHRVATPSRERRRPGELPIRDLFHVAAIAANQSDCRI